MRKIFLILIISGLLVGNFIFAQMTENEKDIMQKMPQPEFIYPTEGMELKGMVKIEIKVGGANSVEFYLRKPESLQEIYLGSASSPEKDLWRLDWDTTKTPNGSYYLFAKITNIYGTYSSLGITISVNNEILRNEEEEKQISEQIQQTEKIGEQQTQEIESTTQSITQEAQILTEPEAQILKESLQEFSEKTKEKIVAPPEIKKEIQEKKEEIKSEILEKVPPLIKPEIKSQLEKLEEKIKKSEKEKLEIIQKISKDSDNDGLPDHEEIRLGTDPFNPDTDGDSFLDGAEVSTGFNPLKPSPADKIVYQDPRKVLPREAEIYKVERVEISTLPTGEIGIKFEGKGRPISFITLYIYSPLLVLTTKTDGNGHWEYILDKPLEEGEHEVFVAVTNNSGEITARSEGFKFIKTLTAVAAIGLPAEKEKVISPSEAFQKTAILLLIAIVILAIGIALIIIGILVRRGEKEIKSKI